MPDMSTFIDWSFTISIDDTYSIFSLSSLDLSVNNPSLSKIIRISLLTPKLGEGVESIVKLNQSELAWTIDHKKIKNNDYSLEVIYEDNILKPWKLILKK